MNRLLLEVVAMKITNNPPASKTAASSAPARSGAAGRSPATAGSGSASTDPAARLSQLEAQYTPSDFSAAKVSEISSAIAAGRYQVDAGAVADKLLASTAALGRKPAGN
jgi:negative regulator of flagellin synthesis FlgM